MLGLNMMDNLLDRCLIARGFLGARNRHNFIYFNRLHWSYLFDGCLIQGEGLRQGQTVTEGFPEPIIRELGLRVRFVFPLAKSASDTPSIKLPQPVAQLPARNRSGNLQQLVAKIPWGHHILILCQENDRVLAEYALRDIQKPIGVSEYELTRALPDNLKSSLPTVEEIEAELSGEIQGVMEGESGDV